MKKQFKLGIIGCGAMATAIIKGISESDFIRARKIIVSDNDEKKLNTVNETYGVCVSDDNRFVAENSEYLVFAVPPRDFDSVVSELQGVCPQKVISVMAGVKKSAIKNALGVGLIRVARCVPNYPCSVGYGMTGIDMSDYNKNTDDLEFIYNLFNCVGRVLSVPEDKLDAVTSISGSGPAYVFMFIDSLIDAGIKQGLNKEEALTLTLQTVLGSCQLLGETDKSLPELIMSVCTKGGTSIEAVKVLEQNNFRDIMAQAVQACANRAKELSDK